MIWYRLDEVCNSLCRDADCGAVTFDIWCVRTFCQRSAFSLPPLSLLFSSFSFSFFKRERESKKEREIVYSEKRRYALLVSRNNVRAYVYKDFYLAMLLDKNFGRRIHVRRHGFVKPACKEQAVTKRTHAMDSLKLLHMQAWGEKKKKKK